MKRNLYLFRCIYATTKHNYCLAVNSCCINNQQFEKLCLQARIPIHRNYCQNTYICWNCKSNNVVDTIFFCSNCGSLMEVNQNCDYFNILGLKDKYNINGAELTKNFRKLQSFLHPDKFSNKSELEQNNSSDWSSLVNKAYQTISVPIKRAEYVLKLKGITIPEDNNIIDKVFLMEMLDKNEEIEDAKTSTEILQLTENVKKILNNLFTELETQLIKKDLEKSKLILIKMKYFTSLEKSLKEKAFAMGVVK